MVTRNYYIIFEIIMNNQGRNARRPDLQVHRRRRFNRSQDKDTVSVGKRALSQCSSDSNLFKFYKPVPKLEKPVNFLDQFIFKVSNEVEDTNLVLSNKKKPKTQTQKFVNERDTFHDPQMEDMLAEIAFLKTRNQELEQKLQAMAKSPIDDLNKENKPMNKMRDRTQKQRIKELEVENSHLKEIIQHLNCELKEIKTSRISEETTGSMAENTFQMEDQLTNNEKQIFELNQEVRKMQIEMDFVNRRNYTQISNLKASHEKEIKSLKDRIQEMAKTNFELKNKNTELVYVIKGTRQKKCNCSKANVDYRESLLELSCSD